MAPILLLGLLLSVRAQEDDLDPVDAPTAEDAAEFQWKSALLQLSIFLGSEHAIRMTQAKTPRELSGPFWSEYLESASSIHTWNDGDSIFTNYVGHPGSTIRGGGGLNSIYPRNSTGRAV